MKTINTIIVTAALMTSLGPVHAADLEGYQQNLLLNPSASQLKAEARGRVMIYDQMENDTVELALNQQFERIENMMFVRTRYVQKDGSIEQEDDCD